VQAASHHNDSYMMNLQDQTTSCNKANNCRKATTQMQQAVAQHDWTEYLVARQTKKNACKALAQQR